MGNTLSDYFKDPSILGEGQDWQDAIFQTAAAQSHSLSVSGGSDKTRFSVSGSWFDQDGIVMGSSLTVSNSRFADAQARSWLDPGGSLSFAHY